MNAVELQKKKRESFNIWFNRWFEGANLKKEFEHAAMQGYTGFNIRIDTSDEYTSRRMRDPLFVNKLQEEFPDLKVSHEKVVSSYKNLLGFERTETVEWIEFCWESDGNGS